MADIKKIVFPYCLPTSWLALFLTRYTVLVANLAKIQQIAFPLQCDFMAGFGDR